MSKTFDSLKLNLTKERFPLVVTATGTSMDPIGFTQCTFFINGRSFTQKFIVCTNQTRPVILGKDSAARNCIGVIWTKQGSRRMVDDCNTTIMEVFEQTKDVPLSLANPIRIPPPKKSQHGEPPKKRLCIDFRKINNLQQAVITEGNLLQIYPRDAYLWYHYPR